MDDAKEMTVQEYFDEVKDRKQHITDKDLQNIYDNCLDLLNKYKITGQTRAMKKLLFHLECIEKEREIIKLGINIFIYRDDVQEYDRVKDKSVKVIELKNYEREIPDEIVQVIDHVKDKFDVLYVVFTDYTGKEEKRIAAERRNPDPILFGTFQNKESRSVVERFYFLGDWVDEYCDLTLDKMVNEIRSKEHKDVRHTISTPSDLEELKAQLEKLEPDRNGQFRQNDNKKPNVFRRIRTAIFGR